MHALCNVSGYRLCHRNSPSTLHTVNTFKRLQVMGMFFRVLVKGMNLFKCCLLKGFKGLWLDF